MFACDVAGHEELEKQGDMKQRTQRLTKGQSMSTVSLEKLVIASNSKSLLKDVFEESCAFEPFAVSIQGTFHQGDTRFKYPGVQCVAVSLVALATHSLKSVFSWTSPYLDKVVVLGDALYCHLKDSALTSGSSSYLMVPDLPKQWVI